MAKTAKKCQNHTRILRSNSKTTKNKESNKENQTKIVILETPPGRVVNTTVMRILRSKISNVMSGSQVKLEIQDDEVQSDETSKRVLRSKTIKKDSDDSAGAEPKQTTVPIPHGRLMKKIGPVKLKEFEINDIVLAKQKYSCPWPARMKAINGKRVFVDFFGDNTHGHVDIDEIYSFCKNSETIKACANAKKNTNYRKGVILAERLLNIPDHLSVFQ